MWPAYRHEHLQLRTVLLFELSLRQHDMLEYSL
jgi:hypothetical protein